MIILQPKEVMQNVEKSPGDSSDYERSRNTMFPFKRHHYVKLLQVW